MNEQITNRLSDAERRNRELAEKMPKAERDLRDMLCEAYRGGADIDEYNRELIVSPNYGCYGHLSSILITVSGSPPKGRLLILYNHVQATIAYFFKGDECQRFLDFRLSADDTHDRKTKRKERMRVIYAFLKERNIPGFVDDEQ